MNITRYVITFMSIFSFLFSGCGKQTRTPIAMSNKELLVRIRITNPVWNELSVTG